MPISILPVTTSGKIEEEGAITECRNMNPQKRSRYKVISLINLSQFRKFRFGEWRKKKIHMMNAMKPPSQETVSDDAPVKFIDSFHQQAFLDNLVCFI